MPQPIDATQKGSTPPNNEGGVQPPVTPEPPIQPAAPITPPQDPASGGPKVPEFSPLTFSPQQVAAAKNEEGDAVDVEKTTAALNSGFNQSLSNVNDQLINMTIDSGVDRFIRDNPAYKEFEGEILKELKNEQRIAFLKQGFPLKDMFNAVVSPYIAKVSAAIAATAQSQAEADGSGTPGYTIRPTVSDSDAVQRAQKALTMNAADFEKEISNVKRGA